MIIIKYKIYNNKYNNKIIYINQNIISLSQLNNKIYIYRYILIDN